MTPESRNALREFIQSEAGREFLQSLINEEINREAQAFMKDATTDTQLQKLNQKHGIYWVRSHIQDLITPTRGGKSTSPPFGNN